MTAAPKTESRTEVAVRVNAQRQPGPNVGKAEVLEEETGRCTSGAAGVGVQASREGFAADNVGKVPVTSRGWSKLQRLTNEPKAQLMRGIGTGT
jgi:hypothetical protein